MGVNRFADTVSKLQTMKPWDVPTNADVQKEIKPKLNRDKTEIKPNGNQNETKTEPNLNRQQTETKPR